MVTINIYFLCVYDTNIDYINMDTCIRVSKAFFLEILTAVVFSKFSITIVRSRSGVSDI